MNEMNHEHHEGGCPGSKMMQFAQNEVENAPVNTGKPVSRLAQWPCQIKLVPTQAPFFDGAKLLIAADCTATHMPTCMKSSCAARSRSSDVRNWMQWTTLIS